MQRSEHALLTNTGTLARRVLKNSQLVFRGHENKKVILPKDIINEQQTRNTYILFPTPEAIELNSDFISRQKQPLTLICPDGHWGQAKKIVRREPALRNIGCLKLPDGYVSQYRLRRNQGTNQVCTFEAILLALGLLEGPEVQKTLQTVFNRLITRLLWVRGKIPKDQVFW